MHVTTERLQAWLPLAGSVAAHGLLLAGVALFATTAAPPPPDPPTILHVQLTTNASRPAQASGKPDPVATRPQAALPKPVPPAPPVLGAAHAVAPVATIPPSPVSPVATASVPVAAASTESLTPDTSTPAMAAIPGLPAESVSPARFDADYLHNPKPDYPPLAKRRGQEGEVLLRVSVSADGLPTQVQLARSSTIPALDEAAIAAVRQWRFVPAKQGNAPVASAVIVPVGFHLL